MFTFQKNSFKLIARFLFAVVSTYKEPFPGWIDNLYGPTGLAAGAVSGLLRVSHCDSSKLVDIVPVDTCVAALIASAWDVSQINQEK